MKPEIHIRLSYEADHAFLFATALRNMWFSKQNDTTLKKNTWMRAQHARLERLFATQPVLIACLSNDHDVILGYRFEDGNRSFTYVKLAFRGEKLGVERALSEATFPEEKP